MRLLGGLLLVGLVGCGGADPYGPPLENAGNGAADNPGQTSPGSGNGTGGNGGAPACGSSGGGPTLTPANPSMFPACGSVCTESPNAHCVPASLLPANVSSALAKCSDGNSYCVPDTLIKSGGAPPPKCKSLSNADGVCLSVCVPQVAQYESLLPQDSCASDERCAPCINPLNQMSSGACDIGKSTGGTCVDGGAPGSGGGGGSGGGSTNPTPPMCPYTGPPLVDVSKLPACGDGAHCLDKSLVPASMQSQLAACAAPNTGLCVPDSFSTTGGNFIPKTCSSLAGAEGRCLNVVIPQVKAQQSQLLQDVCAASEKCVPCFSPLDGSDTGACHLSCDPGPQKPKTLFQDCCKENNVDEGKCVPTTAIPMSLQKSLSQDKCTDATTLCVPTENLQATFMPPACTGQGLLGGLTNQTYTGVCLSKCLHFSFIQQLGIGQGTCDGIHVCAPCTNPLTGQPTGAPGCPATP